VEQRLEAPGVENIDPEDLAPTSENVIQPAPKIVGLAAAFEKPRRASGRSHSGPWFVAAAVGTVILLGASRMDHQKRLPARSMTMAGLISTPERAPIVTTVRDVEKEVGTTGRAIVVRSAPRRLANARGAAARASSHGVLALSARPAPIPVTPAPTFTAPTPTVPFAPAPAAILTPFRATPGLALVVQPSNASPPSSAETPVVPPKPEIDAQLLVKQTLQRYRVAYDGLDARSAQAVWPAVNQAALARAFEALESQSLTFESCDVQLQTQTTATATCRGSARYVPKVGNRDPRTESRLWSFSLRKVGTGWTIDRARVAR
jgi:hypothetical protein